ncbi:MAG: hypothetical protein IJU25_07085 [Lachnospiraceae bacterium]|nr:hypothetical protein [Lachnospiraceae bacterium]
MEGRLFDVSVRIGSKLYPVTYDTLDEYYMAEVPANSTVTVCLTSKDDLWTVSSVFPEDGSKNSGQTQKASKNGEYVLTVADEAYLTATITPVMKVKVAVKGDDNKYAWLDPVKNAYTLNASDTFKAYVVSGSEYYNNNTETEDDDVLLPVPVNATFWNGNKQIVDDDANDGVLITSGATLNLKKLSLKAKVDNKAYTTTLNFVNNPTKVTITSPKVGPPEYAIVVPYGEKATIKVSIDGDLKGVTAWFAEVSEFDGNWQPTGFTQLVNVASIGTFDGKTVTIDPKKAKTVCPEIYRPNGNTELIFYNAQNEKIGAGMEGLNSLIFSAPAIAGQPAPTIKANPSLSTNRMIGLSLTLPKGVKAATGMYYMIEASVAPYEKKDEDKHEQLIDGQKYEYYDRLAYYDDNNDRVVYVFKENAVGFVPATEKACLLPVTNDTGNSEDGWKVDYSVKATLVYADPDNGYAITSFDGKEQKTLSTEAMILSTKDSAYETKLGLTKKLPAKIYNTQNNIPVAMPKWSKNTTVQALDSVELLNEYGNVKGHWSRWDQAGDNERLSVDEESGLITLDTVWMDGTQRRHLEAGKYTLVAYAIGGPGKAAQATLPVTILESIHSLRVSAPMQVQKAFNKAATVKADVAYNVSDWENAPATKSVTWSVVQLVTPATDTDPAVYREIPEDSPLFGNITVKNGTATLNAKLLVNLAKYTPGDYQFVIKATAADYAGNTAEDYSDPIQITTDAQIPTEIQFVWETRDENDNLLREDYSEITEENIAIRDAAAKRKDPYVEPFYSNAIQHAHVRVLNQFGEQIEANLKLSGVTMNQWGELILSKPGKVSVTATSADGSNKSKKIQFTIANGDVRFKPNVLIQDSSRDIDFDASFINIADGKDRWNSAGLKACENIFPSSRYIYVHVAGIRFADVAGKNRLSPWALPDYGCNVMFDHGIKVNGGTIKSTTTDMLENYTTYVILPSAPTTEITLTDKTNDKAYGRTKTDYKYTITNTAINTAKAAQITADKASILNFMYIEKDIYTVDSNPNHVVYTIKDPAEVPAHCNAVVQVYMDDLSTNAKYNLSKFIGMSDDESEEFVAACNAAFDDLKDGYYAEIEAEVNTMEGLTDPEKAELIAQKKDDKYAWFRENFRRTRENLGIFIDVNGGKFDIDFFRENKETRKVNNVDTDFDYWEFFETPAGTYDFYATYGYLDGNDQFHPLNAPTKLSVKLAPAKKPSVNLKKATFEIDIDNDQGVYCSKIEVPNVNDGVGIRSFYQTVSTNSNGTTNRFADLFGIFPAEYADERELMDEEALLIVQRDPDERIPIGSGKNLCYAHVTNWLDLYALKEGQFTSKDDKPEEYNNGEGSKLLGKAADQKKAYQNWVKANCTGLLRMRAVGYDGRDYETELKITVDIEDYLNDLE